MPVLQPQNINDFLLAQSYEKQARQKKKKSDRRSLRRWTEDASLRAVASAKPYVPKTTSALKAENQTAMSGIFREAVRQSAVSDIDKSVLDQHQQDVVNMCMDHLGIFDETPHNKENQNMHYFGH